MKKRLTALLLLMCLCISNILPALACGTTNRPVTLAKGYISFDCRVRYTSYMNGTVKSVKDGDFACTGVRFKSPVEYLNGGATTSISRIDGGRTYAVTASVGYTLSDGSVGTVKAASEYYHVGTC